MWWFTIVYLTLILSFLITFVIAITYETRIIEKIHQQTLSLGLDPAADFKPNHDLHLDRDPTESLFFPAGLFPVPVPVPIFDPAPVPISISAARDRMATMSSPSTSTSVPAPQTDDHDTTPIAMSGAGQKDVEMKEEKGGQEQQSKTGTDQSGGGVEAGQQREKDEMDADVEQANGKKRRRDIDTSPSKSDEKSINEGSPQAASPHAQPEREMKSVKIDEYGTDPNFFAELILHQKAETFAVGGEPQQTPIWICNRDDKVIDVFQGLIKRNILSVPVLLKKNSKYYGFLDLMDIVRYVVAHFGSSRFQQDKAFFELVEEEQHFKEKTVDDLMTYPLSNRNPFTPVIAGYSAFAVIEMMAREPNLHRVPVINSHTSRQLLNLITQSQCIRYLKDNIHMLGNKRKKPISKCVYTPTVLSVSEDTPAIDAFNMMVTKQVQGLAIVTEEGRLRGNLSLRDLKLIGSDAALFWRLHQTVKNFVIKLRAEWQQRHGRPRSVVYVIPSATLEEVIQTLAEHDIHRIYVCDSHQNKKPIGVIALRDVLLEIISP